MANRIPRANQRQCDQERARKSGNLVAASGPQKAYQTLAGQQRDSRHHGQNVGRQLRSRKRKEDHRYDDPGETKHAQAIERRIATPVSSPRRDKRRNELCYSRQGEQREYRKIKIKRRGMVILVRRKAREVMLNNELIDERPTVPRDHRTVPDGRNHERQRHAPKQADHEFARRPLAPQKEIDSNHAERNNDPDQAFGEQRETDKEVESEEKTDRC